MVSTVLYSYCDIHYLVRLIKRSRFFILRVRCWRFNGVCANFEETWIECLGDLARYRMAMEESDLRNCQVWPSVPQIVVQQSCSWISQHG